MSDTTPEPLDLDAIEARANAATVGPWRIIVQNSRAAVIGYHPLDPLLRVVDPDEITVGTISRGEGRDNVDFILSAREDVPALVAEVRRLREQLAAANSTSSWDEHEYGVRATGGRGYLGARYSLAGAEKMVGLATPGRFEMVRRARMVTRTSTPTGSHRTAGEWGAWEVVAPAQADEPTPEGRELTDTVDVCSRPIRVDNRKHSWRFDSDDPRILCLGCGEMRDAISGRVLSVPSAPAEPDTARECGDDNHHGYGTGDCPDCAQEAGQ
ncbi:hypothetical protein EDF35_1917 [Rathayibacter sp. PhB151]|uniref:hypothetical protein n=1 Tax=Rathayibacter sp. PhB151 TaxID=2485189 RepID=UPI001062B2A3|nr:hypothetical protein [Rathayibacter sp. PhB151]TDX78703.1 hypothetical protein EDF35_1917 [Rathayibacter sp. PhB151]